MDLIHTDFVPYISGWPSAGLKATYMRRDRCNPDIRMVIQHLVSILVYLKVKSDQDYIIRLLLRFNTYNSCVFCGAFDLKYISCNTCMMQYKVNYVHWTLL